MKTSALLIVVVMFFTNLFAGNRCEIDDDYNPMMSNIVDIAQQKFAELKDDKGSQNKMMLLGVEYKRCHPKLKLAASAKNKLKLLNARWIWIVTLVPAYNNKPSTLGGGCEIIIADSKDKEIVSVIMMK